MLAVVPSQHLALPFLKIRHWFPAADVRKPDNLISCSRVDLISTPCMIDPTASTPSYTLNRLVISCRRTPMRASSMLDEAVSSLAAAV